MCLQNWMIIEVKDMVFMKDNMSVGNDLEMCQRGEIKELQWSL